MCFTPVFGVLIVLPGFGGTAHPTQEVRPLADLWRDALPLTTAVLVDPQDRGATMHAGQQGRTSCPIRGGYGPGAGPGDSSSRRLVFTCWPARPQEATIPLSW